MSCILPEKKTAGKCNFVTKDAPTHTHTHTHTHPDYPATKDFERSLGDQKVREQPLVFDSFAALPERVVGGEEDQDADENDREGLSP